VTYSNGREGENEVIHVSVDGAPVISFQDHDSGDRTEGWNIFVTDGCVESDVVTLSPTAAGVSEYQPP
jgi:hypothetical protein